MGKETFDDFEVPLWPIFDVRTGNEWLEDTRKKGEPKRFLGDLWVEGEIALLLADHGMGKSILGVQIGESIARGKPVEPFEMTAGPQPVVLLDLELSGRQFSNRYTGESGDTKDEYKFSEDLHRVEVDLHADVPKECSNYSDYLCRAAGRLCEEKRAKVLIVDGIAQLKHSNDATRDLLPLMKGLDKLRREHGLTILVLAPARNRILARSIAIRTLMGANTICKFADSVIAIGPSGRSSKHRYIKHLRSQGSEIMYDSTHVPSFRMEKIGSNFLGLVFDRFSSESDHFEARTVALDWDMIDRIKQMHDSGKPYREIATEVGLSKSTVHQMHQKWRADGRRSGDDSTEKERSIHPDCDPNLAIGDFPGCEEYDERMRDPKYENLHELSTGEGEELFAEYSNFEYARFVAYNHYRKTAKAPPLSEFLPQFPKWTAERNGEIEKADEDEPDDLDDDYYDDDDDDGSDCNESGKEIHKEVDNAGASEPLRLGPPAILSDAANNGKEIAVEPPDDRDDDIPEPTERRPAILKGLKRSVDRNGNEIFVEKENERGKPVTYYQYNRQDILTRWRADGSGRVGSRVNGPICPFNTSD